VKGEFTVASAQRATRRVNIAPFFNVGRPGSYRVVAIVKFPELGSEQGSPPAQFSVVTGRKLWEQAFGLGGVGEEGHRRYSLIQSTLKDRLMLYARVEDTDAHLVLRTVAISGMTSFSEPQALLDREGRLHVLNQFGAHASHHVIMGPEGALIARDIYDFAPRRPALKVDGSGVVFVQGAVKRAAPTVAAIAESHPPDPQLPVPLEAETATNAAPAKKGGTDTQPGKSRKRQKSKGDGRSVQP